jgi:acyl-ACP thioesterase
MRRFTTTRKVRLGDVNHRGRLRLDAIARYLQDVANDDAVDAATGDPQFWVLRKVAFAIEAFPRLDDRITLATWCSGVGSRWAERRTDIGAHVQATALWVYVDPKTLLPARMPQSFYDVWAPSADGRKVRGRLTHDDPPPDGVTWTDWPLRATDHDILDHMNNAAYWHPVEQVWGDRPITAAEIEYRVPITPEQSIVLGTTEDRMWLVDAGTRAVHASVVVRFE